MSILKRAFQWFRRTHDILAIVVCCLWVAGWFVRISYSSVEYKGEFQYSARNVSLDAGKLSNTRITDMMSCFRPPAGNHSGIRWLNNSDRRKIFAANLSIARRLFANEEVIYLSLSEEFSLFVLPTIFIVEAFLIWPIGRSIGYLFRTQLRPGFGETGALAAHRQLDSESNVIAAHSKTG